MFAGLASNTCGKGGDQSRVPSTPSVRGDTMANLKEEIEILQRENGIRPLGSKTSNTDAARIGILVAECFLRYYSGRMEINDLLGQAAFLESDLYFLLLQESFTCDEIPHEDLSHVPAKDRGGYDPLKIHRVREGEPGELAKDIIKILREGSAGGDKFNQANFKTEGIGSVLESESVYTASVGA